MLSCVFDDLWDKPCVATDRPNSGEKSNVISSFVASLPKLDLQFPMNNPNNINKITQTQRNSASVEPKHLHQIQFLVTLAINIHLVSQRMIQVLCVDVIVFENDPYLVSNLRNYLTRQLSRAEKQSRQDPRNIESKTIASCSITKL